MKLSSIQSDIMNNPGDLYLMQQEQALKEALKMALMDEDKMSKQKCKEQWTKHGDKNSALFHRFLKVKQSTSNIWSVHDAEGQVCNDQESINNAFLTYFQGLLANQNLDTADMNVIYNTTLPHISDDARNYLIAEVSSDEIRDTVFSMKSSSAPGPDGFNSHFFKSSWDVVGKDVCDAIKNFFLKNKMLSSFNNTKLALVPKTHQPTSVTQFRPIACCNVVYKCIAKILARRMKMALSPIISMNQSAFLPARNIVDNVLIVQELMRGYSRKNISPRCLLKLDIQKAFDSIQWKSIINILHAMNFPLPFLAWIYTCISTVTYSLSLNGEVFGFFHGTQGIRQGDPISPYLFIATMELLTRLIDKAVLANNIDIHPMCKDPLVTSLMFADDLIIFTKPNTKSIVNCLSTLHVFKSATGLSINVAKSIILTAGISYELFDTICSVSSLTPMHVNDCYLGAPLIQKSITFPNCRMLYDKIINKLSLWPSSKLSHAGRLIVVKSIGVAMCSYFARIYVLPVKLIKLVNSALNHFLWHGNPHSKKLIPISFSKVAIPIENGGLGILNLSAWNKALYSSLIEKLLSDHYNLWSTWTRRNLIKHNRFWTMLIPTDCSGTWRNILKLRETVLPMFQSSIAHPQEISFWHDPWSSPGCILSGLLDSNQRFNTGIPDSSTLINYLQHNKVLLPYSSMPMIRDLWNNINKITFIQTLKHNCWNNKPHSVSTVYEVIMSYKDLQLFPWHSRIWCPESAPKQNFLLWKVINNAIHTQDNLVHRGLLQSSRCLLCNNLPESNTHLFFTCDYTYYIWSKTLLHYNLHRPCRDSNMEWFFIFKATRWKSGNGRILLKLLKTLVYNIWMERNTRLFTGVIKSKQAMVYEMTRTTFRQSRNLITC